MTELEPRLPLRVPLWIGDDRREGDGLVSTDPGEPERVVARAAAATPAEVSEALEAARSGAREWGRRPAAERRISSPTGPLPVNAIVDTSRWRTSAAPTSPSPGSSAIASGGTPASRSARTSSAAQPGACSAGLSTTAFPVARPAAVIPHGIATGKFHGEITATTPRGW